MSRFQDVGKEIDPITKWRLMRNVFELCQAATHNE